ncbi:MAG: hypothetical protein ACKVW3_15530, partial [Phycisphaerales bacterium]
MQATMRVAMVSGLAVANGLASVAEAQCTKEWLPPPAAFIPTTGAGNRPLCSVLWDPDGAGPLREQLVV